MRSARNSTSSPRRALHERSDSHTNSVSPPPSLRLVHAKERREDCGDRGHQSVYLTSPFPTKPEQVLLPHPGKGQEFAQEETSDAETASLVTASSEIDTSILDQSFEDPFDASTVDAQNTNTPSQVWEEHPVSSRSSFPDSFSANDKDEDWEEASDYGDDLIVLPAPTPTIKTVVSESPSPQSPATELPDSSPNVIPIEAPSSPNICPLDNQNLDVPPTTSSSNQESGRSNSLSSLKSFGTVVRYYNAAPWVRGSSDGSSSHGRTYSRPGTAESRNAPSDVQAMIDSGVPVQYPTIRAPSSSGSWVDTSYSAISEYSAQELPADLSSGRFDSHLSTVPSEWSAECGAPITSGDECSDRRVGVPVRPPGAMIRHKPASSSVWFVSGSENDGQDDFSKRPTPGSSEFPTSFTTFSRQSSTRSARPGTSNSFLLNAIPAWARAYYRTDGKPVNSAISLLDASRPSTANSKILGRMPSAANRPKARREIRQGARRHKPIDPRDRRDEWVDEPEFEDVGRPATPVTVRTSWSPHLYPDRDLAPNRGSVWAAPSLDSTTERIFGRRNVQVYCFCAGFLCPLSESQYTLPSLDCHTNINQ